MDSFKNIFYFLSVVVGVPMMLGYYIANPEEFVLGTLGFFFIIFICCIIFGWIKSFLKTNNYQ